MPLSEQDLDMVTRTVLGESSSNPVEQSAVAHTIRNRMDIGSLGGYADTVSGVVKAPYQFEAWSHKNAPNYPMKFDVKSPEYAGARAIVDGVFKGQLGDPTGGYTHFLEPLVVGNRVRSGQLSQWPGWGKQGGMKIGQQVFYPETDAKAQKVLSKAKDADAYVSQFFGDDEKPAAKNTNPYEPQRAETHPADSYMNQYFQDEGEKPSPPARVSGANATGDVPTDKGQQKFNNWVNFLNEHPGSDESILLQTLFPSAAGLKAVKAGIPLARAAAGTAIGQKVLPLVGKGLTGLATGVGFYEAPKMVKTLNEIFGK